MDSVHRQPVSSDNLKPQEMDDNAPFTTSIEPHPDGRWVAVVNLGDGASATKVCDDKAEASRYGDELLRWLGRRRVD